MWCDLLWSGFLKIIKPILLNCLYFQADEKTNDGADQEPEVQDENHQKEGHEVNYEEEEEEEEEGGAIVAKARRRGEM